MGRTDLLTPPPAAPRRRGEPTIDAVTRRRRTVRRRHLARLADGIRQGLNVPEDRHSPEPQA